MDLSKILCEKINSLDLPYTCFLDFLSSNQGLSLVNSAGSNEEQYDWAGNVKRKINYSVVIRGKNNSAVLEQALWRITDMLQNIKIVSEDNSFTFQNLVINELPNLAYQDANRYTQYEMSFSVFIYQTNEQRKES